MRAYVLLKVPLHLSVARLPGQIVTSQPPPLAPAPYPTTLNPTAEPSSSPTNKPTTSHPTINYESGTSTANILDAESSVSPFGCSNTPHNALDGTTEKWSCNRSGQVVASGFEVKPSHGLMTVVKKLRVYSEYGRSAFECAFFLSLFKHLIPVPLQAITTAQIAIQLPIQLKAALMLHRPGF